MFNIGDNAVWLTPWDHIGHFNGEVVATFVHCGVPFVECLCTDPELILFQLRFIAPQRDCCKVVPEGRLVELALVD